MKEEREKKKNEIWIKISKEKKGMNFKINKRLTKNKEIWKRKRLNFKKNEKKKNGEI